MAQRISIRRVLGAITATGLIVATVCFALACRRINREFFEWIDARPITIGVDLSRPGKVTAPFKQTCQSSHGEAFYLTVEPIGDRADSRLLLELDGTITIHDGQGNEVQALEMTSQIVPESDLDEPIMLADFRPFAKGDYTATIDVHRGAPALEGREQTIYAEYHLCGLERFPATISGFFAVVCGIPGLIIGVMTMKGFVKYGLSTRQTHATEPCDAPESRSTTDL